MSGRWLIHYSEHPLGHIEARAQPGLDGEHFKPRGLWVSVGNAWENWCRAEDFRMQQLAHRTRIYLARQPNLVILRSHAQITKFTLEFSVTPHPEIPLLKTINWAEVAEKYDGILIPTYFHGYRLGSLADMATLWYAAWDVASGCIWNPRAIRAKEVLR